MSAQEYLHGGNLAGAAREYGIAPEEFLDFSASINPLGPSQLALQSIRDNLWRISHYPDPQCRSLKEALADYLKVHPSCIALGNGAAELIYLLPRVLNTHMALIAAPTFIEYGIAVKNADGLYKNIPMPRGTGFSLPLEALIKELPAADTIFICNPNNPTGVAYPVEELLTLTNAAAQAGVTVVIDEAFMDFVNDAHKYSLVTFVEKCNNLVVLYSLTKFFSIPGLRLGAAIAPLKLAERLNRARDPWSVNALAQVAGEAGLKDHEYMQATVEVVSREREFLFSGLARIEGIKPFPGTANFLLIDISSTGYKSGELVRRMGSRGILVRDCANFSELDLQCIRVAVRTREENTAMLSVLEQVLKGDRL